jgi:hypothetical protein
MEDITCAAGQDTARMIRAIREGREAFETLVQ